MMCLANVYFFLDGTARQWYVNNEDALDSWEAFKNGLSGLFGDRQRYTRRAEEQLKCRAQRSGESTQSYIQSVLGLCQEVNPLMREDEKKCHTLMKDMKQKRVGRPRFERLPNVVPVASLTDETDLVSLIRTIVREEVHRLVNQTQESLDSDPQSLEEIVQDEVERGFGPSVKADPQYVVTPSRRHIADPVGRQAVGARKTKQSDLQGGEAACTEKSSVDRQDDCHDVILGWDFLEASQAVIDCGQNELVLEDICRDSTAPDAWNLYATRDYTLKPHSFN
ncbi:CCHC-type domain-containing protein [Trichonephila clavipes]|nr:CCHC-type domain-containing protein [Trichonephila clavipes]